MQLLHSLREFLERVGVYAWRTPPRGAHLYSDLRTALPKLRAEMVFDVGANIGQSVDEYLTHFPNAEIHTFEPVTDTFETLSSRFRNIGRVHAHKLAFGATEGTATMLLDGPSDVFRIGEANGSPTETVPISTVDSFCSQHRIDRVNFLKIDVEGFDLEVLKGATQMLDRGAIDVVQVESGMSPRHDWHVPLEDLKAFLEAHKQNVFSIFGQSPNFVPGAPYLVRVDAIFISDRMVNLHTANPAKAPRRNLIRMHPRRRGAAVKHESRLPARSNPRA
jgi:FkbM family methyltransferase